jgi:hypothetical protein
MLANEQYPYLEDVPPGPYVRNWDYVLLLSLGV